MHQEILKTNSKKNFEIGLITLFLTILGYLAYLVTLSLVNVNMDYNILVFVFNWLGVFLAVYVVFTWYKISGYIFSPYIIFMLFFFLFNYGQSLMWALGIHIPTEISQTSLYPGFGVPSDGDIIKAQALTLICILMFHFGAILSYKKNITIKYRARSNRQILDQNNDPAILKSVYYSCLLIGLLVIPITIYSAFYDFQIAMVHGYKSLYYSEFAQTDATFLGLLKRMFFPCLVGLLIGSKYNKKVRFSVYIIFSIYLILNLLSGDRGSWIYKIIILVWLSHVCYKPINFKVLFKYAIVSILGLYFINAIVSLRNIGLGNITITHLLDSLSFENSVLVLSFFEMGGSMKPTILLQKYGWDVWPYANTYLLALLGIVSNKFIYVLDIPFSLISSWFSQDYLGLSWGAGFSIVAEALLNFGPLFAPIVMIFIGYIITSLIYVDSRMRYNERPLRFLFVVSTLNALIPVTRNYFHLLLKDWFYGVIILCIFIILFRFFLFKQLRYSK